MTRGPVPRPIADRLADHAEWQDGCLVWTGYCDPKGYGRMNVRGLGRLTHRLMWAELHGPIPAGLGVLHTCDNPPCMTDEHLFLGTNGDNTADMIAKGRARPHWQGKTHCVHDHPLDAANTYRTPDGRRQCRRCRAEAQQRYAAKR
jgi:hypothetical protein